MAGIYSQGGSAGHRYAGWLSEVEAKNFTFGGKVFNGSPSAIYVGSNLVWTYWLTIAAQQAIRGAFGQTDGKAVIKATNAYLNQLAASDRDKATALAGFINEDPMMVCSLGLEVPRVTMPIRWIVGDGNAYINTGWKPKESNFEIKTRYIYTRLTTNMALYADVWGEGNNSIVFMCGANKAYIQTGTSVQRNVDLGITVGADVQMSHKVNVVTTTIAGTTKTSNTGATSVNDNNELWVCGKQNGADLFFDGKLAYWQLLFGTVEQKNLVPCKHPTQGNGMLDLVNVVFYPNAGTGQFTIPDISYTPSTP